MLCNSKVLDNYGLIISSKVPPISRASLFPTFTSTLINSLGVGDLDFACTATYIAPARVTAKSSVALCKSCALTYCKAYRIHCLVFAPSHLLPKKTFSFRFIA